jgi:hypothetical protein
MPLVITEGVDLSKTMTVEALLERLTQYAQHFPGAKICVKMGDGDLRNIEQTAITNNTPEGEPIAIITIEPMHHSSRWVEPCSGDD